MKKLILCTLFMYGTSLFGQFIPVHVTPNKTIETYDFIDDDIGYAMVLNHTTEELELLKTINGGNQWQELPLPITNFNNLGWSAPLNGVIYMAYRNPITSEPNPSVIYKTTDDGETWIDASPTETNAGSGFSKLSFVDENNGFWVVAKELYKTIDGGVTWTHAILPDGYYGQSIDFFDENTGVMGLWNGTFAYKGGHLTTTDGGENWVPVYYDTEYSLIGDVRQASSTVAYGATVGWGTYNSSFLYKTINNGLSWTQIAIPINEMVSKLMSFDFQDELNGFIAIESDDKTIIYKTINGGQTWGFLQEISDTELSEMHLTPHGGYLSGGENTYYKLNQISGNTKVEQEQAIHFAPNPCTESFTLMFTSTKKEKIEVYSTLGKLMMKCFVYSGESIDVKDWSVGIYIVKFEAGNSNKAFKIIKH